ncbi:MAG: 4'-phosphopantetheinyl transferase superfamily protein [Bacteroidota bacterium]
MVYVYSLNNKERLKKLAWELLLRKLPMEMQTEVNAYRRWEDRQASLGGKLLLRKGLMDLISEEVVYQKLKKDQFQRPYLPINLDFNISHTEELVVCAFCLNDRVGIDIEKEKPINLAEFQRVFTPEEFQLLSKQKDHHPLFFNLWTRKEAVMKADGRGFHLDPADFSGLHSPVKINKQSWFLKAITTPQGWHGHLAMAQEYQIFQSGIDFAQLLNI